MGEWTHTICDPCWEARNPGRVAARFKEEVRIQETCCFCGTSHTSGIYVRENPDNVSHCAHGSEL